MVVRLGSVGVLLTVLLLAVSPTFAAPTYSLIDLGALPWATGSGAGAINNAGQVIGSVYDSNVRHAFLYSGGVMQDLGTLGGSESFAYGLNDAGQVVGHSYLPNDSVRHAFLFSAGAMLDLGALGGAESFARGINDSGQIVAYRDDYRSFIYFDGQKRDLGALARIIHELLRK